MANLARAASRNPSFHRLLDRLLALNTPSNITQALDAWFRERFIYRPEQTEVVRTPEWMLHDLMIRHYLEGDCDDVATLAAAICLTIGLECRFIAIRYHPEATNFEHVYLEIFDPRFQQWIAFDPTVPYGTKHNILDRMIEVL